MIAKLVLNNNIKGELVGFCAIFIEKKFSGFWQRVLH